MPPGYPALTSPENLVVALQLSYRRREIVKYAELLATDFQFVFQPVDNAENGDWNGGPWTAEQDSIGTDALFRSLLVRTIEIDLLYGPAEEPTEIGYDPDVRRIHLGTVGLEVTQTDSVTLLVTQPQDLYVRPGRGAFGEDPARWYLLEWRELPLPAAPKPGGVRNTTWAVLKSRYVS
jgi:hypothetical protein